MAYDNLPTVHKYIFKAVSAGLTAQDGKAVGHTGIQQQLMMSRDGQTEFRMDEGIKNVVTQFSKLHLLFKILINREGGKKLEEKKLKCEVNGYF